MDARVIAEEEVTTADSSGDDQLAGGHVLWHLGHEATSRDVIVDSGGDDDVGHLEIVDDLGMGNQSGHDHAIAEGVGRRLAVRR